MWAPILLRLSVAISTLSVGVLYMLSLEPTLPGNCLGMHPGEDIYRQAAFYTSALSFVSMVVGAVLHTGRVPRFICMHVVFSIFGVLTIYPNLEHPIISLVLTLASAAFLLRRDDQRLSATTGVIPRPSVWSPR